MKVGGRKRAGFIMDHPVEFFVTMFKKSGRCLHKLQNNTEHQILTVFTRIFEAKFIPKK
jgi:hypothetical protein